MAFCHQIHETMDEDWIKHMKQLVLHGRKRSFITTVETYNNIITKGNSITSYLVEIQGAISPWPKLAIFILVTSWTVFWSEKQAIHYEQKYIP